MAGLKGIFKVFDANEREIRRMMPLVEQINQWGPEYRQLSDEALAAKTDEFLERLAGGEGLDDILPEAFAAVREASRRTTGLVHFDVQLIGGVILHRGKIVEMKTGEGKTLVATLPLYLNALSLKGVHLITPNDYLSKVGIQWMGPIYHALGLSVGVIQSSKAETAGGSFLFDPEYKSDDERYQNLRPCSRREAYQAHITYGTNHEFGFDYLRDNMVFDLSQAVQRELHYAIIDEIDNILIDEARTPLIISGPADEASPYYAKFAQLVRILKPSSEESIEAEDPDGDYVYELRTRNVYLTEQGIVKIQNSLGVENLYDAQNAEVLPYLDNALRAHVVFKLDKDYVVQNGEIIIVDDFTGRLMYGRRYSEGLHQAIEAKEGVSVRRENLTHATVTYQNFFRMYGKLAGMTGTAATEGEEFEEIYSLDVTILPTNIEYRAQIGELEAERGKDAGAEVVTYHGPNGEEFYKRVDYPDIVFGTEAIKFAKAADEIEAMHKAGRPVLVGTAAIETSEHLAKLLERRNIPHQVLNAKYHEREAIIIAQAGRPGAVTIATNMAGRGVDILLGGNSEGLARDILRKQGIEITEATPEQWQEALVTAEAECKANRDHVWQQGGLHVIGTERHDARRIDNQLRGRAGRQGDPGSSRFYLSMEDELFRRFGGDRLKGFLKANMGDEPIALGLISKSIEQSQTRVEGYNFDIRKRVLEYDEVVNEQRRVIYEQRRRVLEQDDLRDILLEMAEGEINDLVRAHTQGFEDDWDLEHLEHEVRTWFALPAGVGVESWSKLTPEEIAAELRLEAAAAYDQARERAGLDAVRAMAKSNLRLDQLASMESPPGVYSFLKVLLRQQLPSSLWTQIEVGPVANLSRDEKEQIQQVCSRVLTYQRDKSIMLRTVDSLWVRHLTDLDILREGIGLRAVAQQDPLVAFKKDAHEMYGALLSQIRTEIVALMFQPVPTGALSIAAPRRQLYTNRGGDSDGRQRPVRQAKDTVGRNDPCPCGSGKKYKHCCMKKDRDAASGAHPAGSAQAAAGAVRKRRKRRR